MLIKTIFDTANIPRCLKVARVVPVHKSGRTDLACNYRPISLQSIFATIIEKIAYDSIRQYFVEHHVIDSNQFGFQPHHSCIHACLYHLSTVYQYLDSGLKVGCLYVDIRNAFPSVNHAILLSKLEAWHHLGLKPGWFESYLTNRVMYVDLDGACSASSPITCGVPQGSVLGPTLFNVYYSDVIAEFPHNEITLFADDTAIVASAPKTEELQVAMQSRLTRIDEYLQSLNMELNASKTQALAFFTESFPDLTVRGQAVQSCKSFKYLGVHIDSSLSWDIHAQHVINKVHKNLFVLHRCSGAANIDRRRLLFRAYIYPHFLYGIELFMHCTVALRAKLEALLRRCCRLVMRDTGQITYHIKCILPEP